MSISIVSNSQTAEMMHVNNQWSLSVIQPGLDHKVGSITDLCTELTVYGNVNACTLHPQHAWQVHIVNTCMHCLMTTVAMHVARHSAEPTAYQIRVAEGL